jgi:hypothetical protein
MTIKKMVIDEIISRMEKYPSYNLVIMGHSFGAAIAAIMASNIAVGSLGPKFSPSKIELVTFGSSRVGNKYFAESIDGAGFADVARIVHSTDILPHIAPMRLGYQHYKGEVWLSSVSKKWVTCDDRDPKNPGEALNCANSIGTFHVSRITHSNYWSRTRDNLCMIHMSSKPMEVIFLPKFGLIKY